MTDTQPLATTENVLHPRQVTEIRDLAAQRRATLTGSGVSGFPGSPQLAQTITAQVQNPEAVQKDLNQLEGMLANQAPQPISHDRMDEAVKLEAALREAWLDGMPTQAEMRRNTTGACDKHRAWDKKHKSSVLTWKHLRRRLHASGISDFGLDDESDISNVEKFRPRGGSGEENLDRAQIPQTSTTFLPPAGADQTAIFNDADLALLRGIDPTFADSIGLLDNAARGRILTVLRNAQGEDAAGDTYDTPPPVIPKPPKPRVHESGGSDQAKPVKKARRKSNGWTPERRAAFGRDMKERRERAAEARAAEKAA